jgi:hypothetical protein
MNKFIAAEDQNPDDRKYSDNRGECWVKTGRRKDDKKGSCLFTEIPAKFCLIILRPRLDLLSITTLELTRAHCPNFLYPELSIFTWICLLLASTMVPFG